MNVTYDQFNTQDVAKIIGVSSQAITCWVRKGYINATNVSDGTERARYLFTDEEVTRVQNLIKTYGERKWIFHIKNSKAKEVEPRLDQVESLEEVELAQTHNPIVDKIMELQDLKKQLKNLENKIELLRNEIVDMI